MIECLVTKNKTSKQNTNHNGTRVRSTIVGSSKCLIIITTNDSLNKKSTVVIHRLKRITIIKKLLIISLDKI